MAALVLTGIAGFAGGILAYSFLPNTWPGVAALVVVAGALFLLPRTKVSLLASVFVFLAALGMARVMFVPTTLPEPFRELVGSSVQIEGVVVADPDVREVNQRLTIETQTEGATTRVLVVAPVYPEVRYGELIRAEGTFSLPEAFATDGGRTFSYDTFLAKEGVFALLKNAEIEVIAPRSGILASIRGALSDFKFAGIDALARALPEPHSSLAAGLILGGKQGLGATLLDDFIASGLVHIVVLSGYNVMIVAEFVLRAFGFLPKRRAALLGALTIAAFVLAAGAGAASVRAGIMAGVAVFGRATGRTYDAFRALLLAGVLMVLISPLTLAFDPGFQLSFIATLGLIFGAPLVERRLAFIQSAFLREIAAATIAAQASVLPLLLYQNGLFSLVALPANLLVLPIIPLTMLASALAGVAGFLLPGIAPILAFPAYLLLSYVISVVEVAAQLPLATLSLPSFPFIFVLFAYALLVLFLVRASRTHLQQVGSRLHSN